MMAFEKLPLVQRYDYVADWLLLTDYPYFNKSYKPVAIDLIKQQILDADAKAMQLN